MAMPIAPFRPDLLINYVLCTYGDSSRYDWHVGKGKARASVRGFGDLETVIMHRVWEHGEPVTVRELFDELSKTRSIAYTTVMSTMDNLHRKGWLARERDGKAYRYTAVATREEYSARLMREALAEAGDTEAVLSHFVAAMDGGQAEALRAVLDRLAG
jgi:predicted transcriptional regulator